MRRIFCLCKISRKYLYIAAHNKPNNAELTTN